VILAHTSAHKNGQNDKFHIKIDTVRALPPSMIEATALVPIENSSRTESVVSVELIEKNGQTDKHYIQIDGAMVRFCSPHPMATKVW
jgi:hypothetical protein